MRIKPIIAIMAAPLVLLPAVAVAPSAEAVKPVPTETANPVPAESAKRIPNEASPILSMDYPKNPLYPASGKGTLTITIETLQPTKSVCVAWDYASGSALSNDLPRTSPGTQPQMAEKRKQGMDVQYSI